MASTFTPLGAPPAGVVPNFDNPSDTLYPVIAATVGLCVGFSTAFTVARLVAKRSIGGFSLEDYMLISTWALFMAYNGIVMAQAEAGIGRHIWDVKISNAAMISQLSWAIELMYCPLTFLAKGTLLLQLQHTFTPRKMGLVYIAFQSLIWVNFAFYASAFLAVVLECLPTNKIWDPFITTGHCIDTLSLLISMGAINIISDFCILVLPIWAIWHLHMKVERKLGISAIFSIGLISFISSICRLAYTVNALWTTDTTWLFAEVALWSLAEIATIILCTCFPMMPRLIKRLREKRHGSSMQRRAYYEYSMSDLNHDRDSKFRSRTSRVIGARGSSNEEADRLKGRGIEKKVVMSVVSSKRDDEDQRLRWDAARPAGVEIGNAEVDAEQKGQVGRET